ASNDIMRATEIAREMVTKYGFSEKIGTVNYSSGQEVFLGNDFTTHKNYSEDVAKAIDEEIKSIIDQAYAKATEILTENKEILERVATALLYVETIDGQQFEDLYTGKFTAEQLKENVDKEKAEKQVKDAEEAAEAERIRKEEEEKLKAELEKAANAGAEATAAEDAALLEEDAPAQETEAVKKEIEGEDESNS
ncbi:MAG: zinc metalloprotease, partial [Firmicutes bacterium]|nr:zinc metalloprotease [Bacillota bacterium]